MKGPGICVAQFMRDHEPFNTLDGIAKWASGLGYIGLHVKHYEYYDVILISAPHDMGFSILNVPVLYSSFFSNLLKDLNTYA